MLNNKGFAISSVLYLLLVSFLMFLAITLSQFASSSAVIGRANDDLVDGVTFKADIMDFCTNSRAGITNGTMIRIKSNHGTMYWPKDFGLKVESGTLTGTDRTNNQIEVRCNSGTCSGQPINSSNEINIKIIDNVTTNTIEDIIISDFCN